MTENDLYSGLVRLHILHHACQEPIFGAGIMEELSRHGYRLSPGTLYPLLHNMAEKGYLRLVSQGAGRRARRSYRATAKGRKALQAARGKVRELFAELLEDEHTEEGPLRDVAGVKELLKELLSQLKESGKRAEESPSRLLLETSTEVIKGLIKAFDDYQKKADLSDKSDPMPRPYTTH